MQTTLTHWLVFQKGHVLLKNNHTPLCQNSVATLSTYFKRQMSLGTMEDINYHCAEIESSTALPEEIYSLPLRVFLSQLSPPIFSLVVKAYALIQWDKNHQFCSRCGCATKIKPDHFERYCSPCELAFFPKLSPAIIVLIKKGDHLLMARSPHYAPGTYGLIAGFVDPGETLEHTVQREVYEEVGLKIKNITYFGSQPWPFPDSLMIAFQADFDGGEICIDHHEITEANWYKYDRLPGLPSSPCSIAMKLIENFVASCSA